MIKLEQLLKNKGQMIKLEENKKYKTESREVNYLVLYWIYALHINDHCMAQMFSNVFQNDPKVKMILNVPKLIFESIQS